MYFELQHCKLNCIEIFDYIEETFWGFVGLKLMMMMMTDFQHLLIQIYIR